MVWKVAEAKQKFSEVLRRAALAPQLIHNRDRVVGAVIGPEDVRALLALRSQGRSPLVDALREARQICEEDEEDLVIAPRADRPNSLFESAHARRHQHRQ
jgi:hypothetical protein